MKIRISLISTFIISIASTFLFSCNDDEETQPIEELNGTYKGIFIRSSPTARFKPADVTLTFNENKFEGSSSETNYPAICNGTFQIIGNSIEFTNDCFFTANFDWKLILNGTFEYKTENGETIITRSYEDDLIDTYRLTKE